MRNRIGWYLRAKREARGLSTEALAVRVGYRNIRKGVQRILRLEQHGLYRETMLVKLADALGVNYATILDLMERDAASGMQLAIATQRQMRMS